MTTERIQLLLSEIEQDADEGDSHDAHVGQDNLFVEFIEYVATQDGEIGQKAKLVLTVLKIDFERWFS